MLQAFEVNIFHFLVLFHRIWSAHSTNQGKETEHNWAARERAILRVRGMLKGEVHLRYTDTFLASFKEGFVKSSLKAVSEIVI
jgi:hypothetical protein